MKEGPAYRLGENYSFLEALVRECDHYPRRAPRRSKVLILLGDVLENTPRRIILSPRRLIFSPRSPPRRNK